MNFAVSVNTSINAGSGRRPSALALVPAILAVLLLSGEGAQGGMSLGEETTGEVEVGIGVEVAEPAGRETAPFIPPPHTISNITAIRILESHMRLLARLSGTALMAELGIDTTSEAFRIADTLRGQGVQRALNASAARASAGSPGLAKLVRREQDTANRIGALTALHADLPSRSTDRQDAGAQKTLPATIAQLRVEHKALSDQIARRFPAYASLMAPPPPTIARARKSLHPKEALIATYVGERESYVWAVPKTGQVEFAVVPLGRARIAAMVAKLRLGIKPTGKTVDTVPKFDVKTAHDLYLALLAPVAAGWKGATDLLVVAHGPLGQVPFSVLVTRETVVKDGWADLPFAAYQRVPWLARSHGVTALPTVAALITLRKLAPAAAKRRAFAGFADPWFSQAQAQKARSQAETGPELASYGPASGLDVTILLRSSPDLQQEKSATLADLKRLPDTAREVRSIARALKADPARDLFIGPRANEHRVKTMDLSRYKVIAFASHALLAGSLDGLTQPALAMTAPDVAGVKGDGLLTMGEILGLKLDADWVVLSACDTAAANGAGAEAVSGLGRAFLYAGTRSLLITHWPIESKSARS
ncbi:MAG: CHAT domain-containing protein, partial [Alphaproteobacteria bacterium]|nr:CHAT domain-containing protein [Alphaproteobacteria bacterium]